MSSSCARFPVPFRAICELLGLDYADRREFAGLGSARFDATNGAAAAFGWVALRRFKQNAQALLEGRHLDDARPAALATALLVVTALAAVGYVLLL